MRCGTVFLSSVSCLGTGNSSRVASPRCTAPGAAACSSSHSSPSRTGSGETLTNVHDDPVCDANHNQWCGCKQDQGEEISPRALRTSHRRARLPSRQRRRPANPEPSAGDWPLPISRRPSCLPKTSRKPPAQPPRQTTPGRSGGGRRRRQTCPRARAPRPRATSARSRPPAGRGGSGAGARARLCRRRAYGHDAPPLPFQPARSPRLRATASGVIRFQRCELLYCRPKKQEKQKGTPAKILLMGSKCSVLS